MCARPVTHNPLSLHQSITAMVPEQPDDSSVVPISTRIAPSRSAQPGRGLRVLFVTNMYPSPENPRSGIFVARQAESLRRKGVDLAVIPVAGSRGESDYWFGRSRVRVAVEESRPHVVHAHFGYALVAALGMGVPSVVTLYGDDVNGESNGRGGITLKSRLGVEVSMRLARRTRRVLVQSRAMRERLPTALRSRCMVVPSGVDEALFEVGDPKLARTALGIGPDELVICFVFSGRQRTKRIDLAEGVRDELLRRGHTVRLLVVVDVPVDDMPIYYRAADVLLMTSDSEGSPNCVKEALACGVPVVSVPVGDVPDILNDVERGLVVPERDPGALADGVEQVVRRQGGARVSLLPMDLREASVADRLVELYRGVANLPAPA